MTPAPRSSTASTQPELAVQMRACEETLLHSNFTAAPDLLDGMLTADFIEVASNGRVTPRADVLRWLLHKDPDARWQLCNVHVTELSEELRLVRYHAQQVLPRPSAGKGALHCSLWSFNAALQHWQLRFHQATRIL